MPDYEGPIRICSNPKCRTVYRPDNVQWKESDKYCPACGTILIPEDQEVTDGQGSIGTKGYV